MNKNIDDLNPSEISDHSLAQVIYYIDNDIINENSLFY